VLQEKNEIFLFQEEILNKTWCSANFKKGNFFGVFSTFVCVIRSFQLYSTNVKQRNDLAQKVQQHNKNVIINSIFAFFIYISHHTNNVIHEQSGAQE